MSSALAGQLPGDRVGIARLTGRPVALHEQRGCARGVRGRCRGADHRDAGPDRGRGGRDDIGLQPPVLGRALRGVVGRGVALPVARADRERAARVAGRRDARLDGCLVTELDAAAEDLEVADDARGQLLDAQAVGCRRTSAGSPRRWPAARRPSGPARTRRASSAPCPSRRAGSSQRRPRWRRRSSCTCSRTAWRPCRCSPSAGTSGSRGPTGPMSAQPSLSASPATPSQWRCA